MKSSHARWTLNRRVWLSILIPGALGLLASPAAAGRDQVGEISYLEEGVSITRSGRALDEVDFGTPVENFDLLATDKTGFAEVKIASSRTPEATLKVSPNTAFYFELSSSGRKASTTFQLLSGSLALKVQKVTGSKSVNIRTETATMGVRGTQFQVTISPGGDLLITAEEGRVSCLDEEGQEEFATPGQAVEQLSGEPIRAIPVSVAGLEAFREEWYTQRMEIFKANALKAVRSYAARYLDLNSRFNQAYDRLMSHSRVIRKWSQEDRQNTVGGKIEIMREKKEIIRDLLAIRKILFLYERVYFRVQELAGYHEQGYGRGQVRAGMSTASFFQRFDQEKKDLQSKMDQVRYVTKLYALRNDGSFPADGLSMVEVEPQAGSDDEEEEEEGF